MTTTSTFSGIKEDGKTSSRVLKPPGGGSSNIFGPAEASASPKQRPGNSKPEAGVFVGSSSDSAMKTAQRSARDGHYNPITGTDYKDLAPNHHALHVRELPKPQKEQPPLPCSDGEYQAKGGKMQNVQTSTRISNPPGGKTHKLW